MNCWTAMGLYGEIIRFRSEDTGAAAKGVTGGPLGSLEADARTGVMGASAAEGAQMLFGMLTLATIGSEVPLGTDASGMRGCADQFTVDATREDRTALLVGAASTLGVHMSRTGTDEADGGTGLDPTAFLKGLGANRSAHFSAATSATTIA